MRDLMEYGSFFFGSAALLAALAVGTRALARRRFRSAAARSLLENAALALMAVLAPLVVAEGAFLFFIDTTDDALATLTSRRWVMRHLPLPLPTYRGRNAPSTDASSRPTLSIAVLGDSLTYGQGIERDEDLYPSLLERELRARGIAVDVYNISRPGWNTGEEMVELWKMLGAGATFDAVVLGFCLNDIGDFVDPPPGFREAAVKVANPPAALKPLVANSFVASFLYNRSVNLASPEIGAAWERVADAYRVPETFAKMTTQLENVVWLADSYGVPLAVTTFPSISFRWGEYPYRDIHRKLDEFWRQLGVPHVDLLAAFERHPVRTLKAGLLDAHPGELAHRVAAVSLADALAKPMQTLLQSRGPGRAAAGQR